MKLASALQQAVITSESGASDASRSRNIASLHVVLSSNSVAAFPSCLAPTLHAISLKRLARRASHDRLTKRQQERLRAAFTAHEAHISVEVAYLHRATARGLPPSHTRPRPTPGHATSSRACQRVPSPNSLAWAGPHASGRTPSWPTSTQEEPATAPPKPSTESSN